MLICYVCRIFMLNQLNSIMEAEDLYEIESKLDRIIDLLEEVVRDTSYLNPTAYKNLKDDLYSIQREIK